MLLDTDIAKQIREFIDESVRELRPSHLGNIHLVWRNPDSIPHRKIDSKSWSSDRTRVYVLLQACGKGEVTVWEVWRSEQRVG